MCGLIYKYTLFFIMTVFLFKLSIVNNQNILALSAGSYYVFHAIIQNLYLYLRITYVNLRIFIML
jgi:hypothetical protein